MTRLDAVITKEFANAEKDQKGTILRRNAIKVLQNVFKQNNGTYQNKEEVIGGNISTRIHNYAYAEGFGYGYGGFLSQTKDLFELYMDKDSEGGESITRNEQNEIVATVRSWFMNLIDKKADTLVRSFRG